VLPGKLYALSVIDHATTRYLTSREGLRPAVWGIHGVVTPAHTTLHAWTEGAGAHALGRSAGEVGGTPMSALIQETSAHVPGAREVFERGAAVDAGRFRSPARRERLSAVVRLLAVATLVAGVTTRLGAEGPLCTWRSLALTWGLVSPLTFRTGLLSTGTEHMPGEGRARSPP
jgi:hypothetical protein